MPYMFKKNLRFYIVSKLFFHFWTNFLSQFVNGKLDIQQAKRSKKAQGNYSRNRSHRFISKPINS